MADINVQQKGGSIWPWVLGLILLAGLVWVLIEVLGGDDDPMAVDDMTQVTAPVGAEMQMDDPVQEPGLTAMDEYLEVCSAPQTTADMSLSHQYTANCVRLLAGALGSVVQRDTVGGAALNPALLELNESAAELQTTPETSPNHSSMVREIAMSAADLMAQVQQTRAGPGASSAQEVTQARAAAEAIRSDTPLMEQQQVTGEFFRRAGEALRVMS
jgi:hypothetical protein